MKLLSRLFPILFFAVLLFVSTYPSFLHLGTKLIGDGYDNYEFIGFQHLVRDRLAHFQYPFSWTDYLRFPIGFDIGKGFDGLYAAVFGGLLGFITTPIIAFNLTVYSIYFLNYLFGYLLFKKISSSAWIAAFCAGIFAFSSYTLARNGSHINLTLIAGFPLILYSLIRLREEISPANLSIFDLGIVLTSVGSLQYLLILGLSLVILFSLSLTLYPIELSNHIKQIKSHWKSISLFLLALVTIGIGLHFSYFRSLVSGTYSLRSRQEAFALIESGMSDMFIPNSYLTQWFVPFFKSSHRPSIESAYFLGYVEIVLLAAVLLSKINRRTKIFWGSSIVIFFLLTSKTLYKFLLPIFPFSAIPEPGRFVVPVLLSVAVLITHLLTSTSNSRKFPLLFIILSILLVISKATSNFYTSSSLDDPSNQIIRLLPGQAVLDFPFDTFETKRHLQVFNRDKKALDGFVHWSADDPITRSFIDAYKLDDYACIETNQTQPLNFTESERNKNFLFDTLKLYEVGGIVIHKDSKILYTQCQAARAKISSLVPETTILRDTNGKVETFFHENSAAPYLQESLFFPQSGTLNLNGVLIYPTNISPPKILLNQDELGDYTWLTNQNGLNLSPKDRPTVEVPAGSTLTIYSPTPLFLTTYATVWYSFKSDESSIETKPRIEKVFDNQFSTVYRLN